MKEAGPAVTAEIKSWWAALPNVEKVARAVIGLAILVYGGILGFDRAYQTPKRVDAAEVRIGALEVDVGGLKQQARRSEYLFCVDLADRGLISKTPADCYQDYAMGER